MYMLDYNKLATVRSFFAKFYKRNSKWLKQKIHKTLLTIGSKDKLQASNIVRPPDFCIDRERLKKKKAFDVCQCSKEFYKVFKVSRAFGIPQRYLYFINWLHWYTIPPVSLFISTKGRRVRYSE
jgi:hypothetical protein